MQDVEIEQVVDDDDDSAWTTTDDDRVAARSLPTPMSAPRYGPPLPRNPRARTADVPVSALNEIDEADLTADEGAGERGRNESG